LISIKELKLPKNNKDEIVNELPGTAVQVKSITKRYGNLAAVDRVSIEIIKGEFLSLLGPSGSGKTTLLMMIAGFVIPSDGEIYIHGREVSRVPPEKRNVGMVFQNYALFPHMTVKQNIAFPLKMRKMPPKEIQEEIDRILTLVRLPGFGNRYPNQLSGGQQQRIALARALVFRPHILLMDEPLGALDKKLRELMQIEIVELHKKLKITVVYVTHDQEEALAMSDRIAVIDQGHIIQLDSPGDVYDKPKTKFVADFVGSSNLIPVTIASINEGVYTILPRNISTEDLVFQSKEKALYNVEDHATLMLRPEKIKLSKNTGKYQNEIQGSIKAIIYLGLMTKYEVQSSVGTLEVVVQNEPETERYRIGDKVIVGWELGEEVLLGS
jgi:spermidine/putrescine ABC transporter ATP-binding subunit